MAPPRTRPIRNTYRVSVIADALKSLTVTAGSYEEAVEMALTRARRQQSGWLVDFPGDETDHVRYVEKKVGPDKWKVEDLPSLSDDDLAYWDEDYGQEAES